MKAIEFKAKTDNQGQLKVDIPLQQHNKEERLIILLNEDEQTEDSNWLHFNSKNPSFDFLNEPEEDVYSLNDGEALQND